MAGADASTFPRRATPKGDIMAIRSGLANTYVRRGAIPAEYALYAELLGTPGVEVSAAFSSTCRLPV